MLISAHSTEISIQQGAGNYCLIAIRMDDCESLNYISPFIFVQQAGQWVDMLIPGVETVGGFSICNSPENFKETQQIQLAVKFSMHPPAHWIHDKVSLRDHRRLNYDDHDQS